MATPKKQDRSSWGNFGQPQNQPDSPWQKFEHITMPLSNLHSGGKVKKTGNYRLRKGEIVLTKAQQKSVGIENNKKTGSRKRSIKKG